LKNKLFKPPALRKIGVKQFCIICKKELIRRKDEAYYNFSRRKTCGKYKEDEKWIWTKCLIEKVTGKNNPNYKGYMPSCKVCGKRVSYNSAKEMKEGIAPRYCKKHFLQQLNEKGVIPKQLKPYLFKKGEIQKGSEPYLFKKGKSYLHLHKDNCGCFVCYKK
jgi:hypothetical protein|tara:strand:- start:2886 stop:3371 length:486 start_codon:yes stop_codon:yes gene_type:complete